MQAIEFDRPLQAELVARAKSGDRVAFGRIYDQTFPLVYRYAMALTGSREDAEDLTAETYERALKNVVRFESREVPIAIWLLRIARNIGRERAARHRRQPTVCFAPELLEQLAAEGTAPQFAVSWDGLLSQLSPAQREVIALRLSGLRGREIAELLGKAEGTIKALQFAAIRNLRRTVSP